MKKFSLGMKQRLAIALALLPNPELLVLDEPANGLDPAGFIELRELIKTLNKTYGMTILISSHLLAEIEKIVSHIGIIFKGKMVFQGTLAGLHEFQQKDSRLMIDTSDNEKAIRLLQVFEPQRNGQGFSVSLRDQKDIVAIQGILVQNNLAIYLLQPKGNDLEQLFIDLTTAQ
jgi:ABC-2 type transport system ATP-binding protein